MPVPELPPVTVTKFELFVTLQEQPDVVRTPKPPEPELELTLDPVGLNE